MKLLKTLLLSVFLFSLLTSSAKCQPVFDYTNPPLEISDASGSVVTFPYKAVFPNGTLTSSGGIVYVMTSSNGVASGPFVKTDQSTPQTITGGAPIFGAGLTSLGDIRLNGSPTAQDALGKLTDTGYLAFQGGSQASAGAGFYLAGNSFAGAPTLGPGDFVMVIKQPGSKFRFQYGTTDVTSISETGTITATGNIVTLNTSTANVVSVNAIGGAYYLPYGTGSTGQVITLQTNGTSLWQTPSASGGGHTIQDEGVGLTQRSTMNFTGAGVTATDTGGVTVVTIGGASNAPSSGSVVAVFDGGGSAIATGAIIWARIPYACTLTEWDINSYSTSPTLVVDVKKSTYASFDVPNAPSIAASAKPTLTNQQKNTNTTLSGWTTAVSSGDYIYFYVTNIDKATVAVVTLSYTKS